MRNAAISLTLVLLAWAIGSGTGSAVDPHKTIGLTLTAPQGGETWAIGTAAKITWSAGSATGSCRLVCLRNGQLNGTIAVNLPIAAGSYVWPVSQLVTGSAEPGTGYQVRVETEDGKSTSTSQGSFSIVPAVKGAASIRERTLLPLASQHSGALALTAPQGGASLAVGSTEVIRWSADGVAGTCHLVLLKDGKFNGTIAVGLAVSQGAFSWTVGKLETGSAEPGTGYQIRIESEDGKLSGVTKGYVSLVPPYRQATALVAAKTSLAFGPQASSGFTLTAPQGGEAWKLGSAQQIRWTATTVSGTCRVILLRGGQFNGTIAIGLPVSQGAIPWTVGKLETGSAEPGSGYQIRIEGEGSTSKGFSKGTFSILAQ